MGEEKGKRRRSRMTLPKSRSDLEKITEEVQQMHEEEHHHHHHHHGEIDEALLVIELLLDSLNATVNTLQTRVKQNGLEIARIYKILSYIIEALASENEEKKLEALRKARAILEKP